MTIEPGRKLPETPFGVRLRAARKMAGMSMEDLAAKLGGRVTKQAISKYEKGRMMPSPEVMERLVDVLKIATWGASPLKTEDALDAGKQLILERTMLLAEGASLPRLALRRRGLLSLLKRDRTPEEAKGAKGAEDESLLACCSVVQDEPLLREDEAFASRMLCESPPAMPREQAEMGSLADRRARYLVAWHSDDAVNEIKFRAGEKLSAKTESALKYRIADHLQRYFELESVLGAPAAFENPLGSLIVRKSEEVEAAAGEVRSRWELGTAPVVNLLGLLEDKGIKVYEARGIEGFEGLSGRFGIHPFVAVSLDVPADRVRFTAAHELGHVLCGFAASESPESECHAFGAAFLLPRTALEKAFAPSRRKVTLGELGEIKQTYGVSLQAIMYRAHGLGLVSGRQLRAFRETIKARGWVVEEPVAYAGVERATRFRRLLHYAVAAGIMDAVRAAEMGGVPVEELEKEIGEIF
jgi:Zn-dependent peptidase ImmA (M78 family)/transcriptional regulator with XRE-family HTH domain